MLDKFNENSKFLSAETDEESSLKLSRRSIYSGLHILQIYVNTDQVVGKKNYLVILTKISKLIS